MWDQIHKQESAEQASRLALPVQYGDEREAEDHEHATAAYHYRSIYICYGMSNKVALDSR